MERHQGPGCASCIFLFIIDDTDPDRHTTHVIWIHSWFQMTPLSGLHSDPSLCVEGEWERECVCLHLHVSACRNTLVGWRSASFWQMALTVSSWLGFSIYNFFDLLFIFYLNVIVCLALAPVRTFRTVSASHSVFTAVDSWGLIDQISKYRGVCLVSSCCLPKIHLVFSKPRWFVWPCV